MATKMQKIKDITSQARVALERGDVLKSNGAAVFRLRTEIIFKHDARQRGDV